MPFGTVRTSRNRQDDIAPVDGSARARADIAAAFATTRHPYVRIEPRNATRIDATAYQADTEPVRPHAGFTAQFIAQEQARQGLELDKAADGTRAYRRAEIPLVEIRTGATVDVAA